VKSRVRRAFAGLFYGGPFAGEGNARAKPTPRGWRLVKSADGAQIDAVIALAIAAERAEKPVNVPKVVGWL
jgi:hypothetical protein